MKKQISFAVAIVLLLNILCFSPALVEKVKADDTTPPVISLFPYKTTITNRNITVVATTNEGTIDSNYYTFSANGSHTFTATDAAGNVSTQTVTINNIDKALVMGDANLDSSVTSVDALKALQAAAGRIVLNESEQCVCDVNFDNIISSVDALNILQYASGAITSFPYNQFSNIYVTSALNNVALAQTESISSSIYPSSPTNNSIAWVVDKPDIASISTDGTMLTPLQLGTVTVKGIALDGSGVVGTKSIVISETGTMNGVNPTDYALYINGPAVSGIGQYIINGNVYVNGDLNLSMGQAIHGYTVANGAATISSGATTNGLFSFGNVNLETSSIVNGYISTKGDIIMSDGALVTGKAYADGNLNMTSGAPTISLDTTIGNNATFAGNPRVNGKLYYGGTLSPSNVSYYVPAGATKITNYTPIDATPYNPQALPVISPPTIAENPQLYNTVMISNKTISNSGTITSSVVSQINAFPYGSTLTIDASTKDISLLLNNQAFNLGGGINIEVSGTHNVYLYLTGSSSMTMNANEYFGIKPRGTNPRLFIIGGGAQSVSLQNNSELDACIYMPNGTFNISGSPLTVYKFVGSCIVKTVNIDNNVSLQYSAPNIEGTPLACLAPVPTPTPTPNPLSTTTPAPTATSSPAPTPTPTSSTILVSSITVTSSGSSISTNGQTMQMSATVLPSNAANKGVAWSVSDTSLASIDQTGLLTPLKNGNVIVTATAMDGSNVKGTKTITLSNQTIKITDLMLSTSTGSTTLKKGGYTMTIIPTITPSNATNQTITWSVDSTKYATIDNNGVLTSKSISGKTVIVTATTTDGSNITRTIEIMITN